MANKFKAIKTKVNGNTCDSKLEAGHYIQLLTLERYGKISHLKFHPRYPIKINDIHICNVCLDFEFYDNLLSQTVYVDSKGMQTSESKLRHKLFEAYYDKKIEIWRK